MADATWVYENWENQELLEAGKEINYFNLADFDPLFDFCAPAVAATHQVCVTSAAEVIGAFLAALDRGYRRRRPDPEGAVLEVKDMLPGVLRGPAGAQPEAPGPHSAGSSGAAGAPSAPERWERMADWLVADGSDRPPPRRPSTPTTFFPVGDGTHHGLRGVTFSLPRSTSRHPVLRRGRDRL